jgi:hypothetical protein
VLSAEWQDESPPMAAGGLLALVSAELLKTAEVENLE